MKYYLLAVSLLLAGTTASAQPVTPAPVTLPVNADTHLIAYSGIIAVPGASKNELYARGTRWFTALPPNLRIILVDDQQAGLIVGRIYSYKKAAIVPLPNSETFWCMLKLSFQEGKYRYLLTNFQFKSGREGQDGALNQLRYPAEQLCFARSKNGTPTKRATRFSKGLDQQAQRLVASIESGMVTGGEAR